jgi:hypothetical protein
MDFSKFERLPQVKIDRPCPESWEEMDGDEQRRHCSGCGCSVHNVAEMSASEVEALLMRPEGVCARLTVDDQQNVLTRDGWIPRMLLAGAIAATVAGCAPMRTSIASSTGASFPPSQFEIVEDQIVEVCDNIIDTILPDLRPRQFMGFISERLSTMTSMPTRNHRFHFVST